MEKPRLPRCKTGTRRRPNYNNECMSDEEYKRRQLAKRGTQRKIKEEPSLLKSIGNVLNTILTPSKESETKESPDTKDTPTKESPETKESKENVVQTPSSDESKGNTVDKELRRLELINADEYKPIMRGSLKSPKDDLIQKELSVKESVEEDESPEEDELSVKESPEEEAPISDGPLGIQKRPHGISTLRNADAFTPLRIVNAQYATSCSLLYAERPHGISTLKNADAFYKLISADKVGDLNVQRCINISRTARSAIYMFYNTYIFYIYVAAYINLGTRI